MESATSFEALFQTATGNPPYDYQTRLAIGDELPELIDVPTGLGKTAAIILAWLWRRRFADDSVRRQTPRRLVYCLPMRTLVEQTAQAAGSWLRNAACVEPGDGGISVHVLMGGEEQTDWAVWPEQDAILIGTQDMLLSRALNRGFAARRARWPVEFGMLHNDCLWVFDEVQLMGNGIATSAQLDAFRDRLWSTLFPCRSLWMSATIGEEVLRTRDRDDLALKPGIRLSLSEDERIKPEVEQRLNADKTVAVLQKQPDVTNKNGTGILDLHLPGRLSLVMLNTVATSQRMFDEIRGALLTSASERKARRKRPAAPGAPPIVLLLHSRFRPADRRERMAQLESFRGQQDPSDGAVRNHSGLILVSTQVIEAGYDISAAKLWSEIAPWASVIQRLGRLNREGRQPDALGSFWMPKAETKGANAPERPNARRVGPYEKRDLEIAGELISEIISGQNQGLSYREALDAITSSREGRGALTIKPEAVLRPDDLYGLFSTEPDLAGGFTDVSPFVRSVDRDTDVSIFWRAFDLKDGPNHDAGGEEEPPPHREELCAVPFFVFRDYLGSDRSWEWDFEYSRWQPRRAADIFPGMTLLLACSQGGYSSELGWTGLPGHKPPPVGREHAAQAGDARRRAVDGMNRDPASETCDWHFLSDHLDDVVAETDEIIRSLGTIPGNLAEALRIAAGWHDWGKSLPRWQKAVQLYAQRTLDRIGAVLDDRDVTSLHPAAESLQSRFRRDGANANVLWAKFPDARRIIGDMPLPEEDRGELWRRVRAGFRPNLRHEAASALAAWHAWLHSKSTLTGLAVYLIAAHHGKVRTVLRALRDSDEVFGLKPIDQLRPVPPRFGVGAELNFAPKVVGNRGQWSDDGTSFRPADPCWTAMVAELLGPAPGCPSVQVAITKDEPAEFGPFTLAYLEALLRAADVRASDRPGRGVKP